MRDKVKIRTRTAVLVRSHEMAILLASFLVSDVSFGPQVQVSLAALHQTKTMLRTEISIDSAGNSTALPVATDTREQQPVSAEHDALKPEAGSRKPEAGSRRPGAGSWTCRGGPPGRDVHAHTTVPGRRLHVLRPLRPRGLARCSRG